MLKFKIYIVAVIAAIFSGAVRAAYLKRQGKTPDFIDGFYYVIMTLVITLLCAGLVYFFKLPVNDELLVGYGAVFMLIGQFTDLIYLRAGQQIDALMTMYGKKFGKKKDSSDKQ